MVKRYMLLLQTGSQSNKGKITEMTLSLHGTKDPPKIYQNGPRPYDDFKLAEPVGIPNMSYFNKPLL